MTKKEMLKAKMEQLEILKAEIEQLKADIKAEEIPKEETKVTFDAETFEKLLDREAGKEMLNNFSTPELKQIAKTLSVKLIKTSKQAIIERIVEVVIGGNIRRYTLDNMQISENLGYNEF